MHQGTIENREAFLDKIAAGLGRERRSKGVKRPGWQYQPQKDVYQGMSQDELVGVLEKACEAIHTEVTKTTSADLNEKLSDVIVAHGGAPVVTSADARFTEYGLDRFLQKGDNVHVWDSARGKENIGIAEKANIGLTFSDITLAESGTVVLFSDKGKARSVSLLPKTYVAIIPQSTIVPRMTQAAHEIHKWKEAGEDVASCVNFVSGPSNSADIELNLVVGVHGPVRVTYIIVTDR